jgi:hypothetical protein
MGARDNDPGHLHPTFRALDDDLKAMVTAAELPIEPYEGWRDPNRQAFLFAEGRTPGIGTEGHHVTFEGAWEGLHQYGLARDWVWKVNGVWTWTPPAGHSWLEFHAMATKVGLMFLDFEQPHIQLPGVSARDILSGKVPYPDGGDDTWETNLEAAIVAWGRAPKMASGQMNAGAPSLVSSRPVISVAA